MSLLKKKLWIYKINYKFNKNNQKRRFKIKNKIYQQILKKNYKNYKNKKSIWNKNQKKIREIQKMQINNNNKRYKN